MRARAHAKVNLALVVHAASADGYHPLHGIFQSVSLADVVTLDAAAADSIEVSNDEVPSDETNLAWRAVESTRRAIRINQPFSLGIDKEIPAGAGLGGGSADAAATVGLLTDRYRIDPETATEVAEGLGADVPFAFTGGTMLAEGRGERLTALNPLSGFGLGLVVPPFSMSTPAVFGRWDELGCPTGDALPESVLPPALRDGPPIRNDLYPAAASLDRRIEEWRDELVARWGTGVAMTGSGSALFGFFPSLDEARDAAASIDIPTRLAAGVEPVRRGWEAVDD